MVLTRTGLFTAAWVNGLKHVPEQAMVATITVTDPRNVEQEYDPETDEWVEGTPVTIYEGKARVQPIRSEVDRQRPGDSTSILAVRFSIPIASIATDIRKGMRVRVTEAALNPTLLQYSYYVNEAVDSSNPLEKTFHAVTDLEATWDSNG